MPDDPTPPPGKDNSSEFPTSDPSRDDAASPSASGSGRDRIGRFRLVRRLGEGGMGEVWLAEQTEPIRRRVALKLIRVGMDTKEVVARFEAERQALAILDHPSVARVYEAGETEEGRPYFVMEYVAGQPITEFCDHKRMPPRERLELFRQVCEGVQHAHQRAIIHRDLKPSNVLVTMLDDRPVPKIIDFGIAKATAQRLSEATLFTHAGQIVGTPAYMSPEQADRTVEDIDTRTDVYSLGVMLYELLVGVLPLDHGELRAAGLEEMRRRIREIEPERPSARISTLDPAVSQGTARSRGIDPSTLRRELAGDLDWITMKALEKDRARRYDSPRDLASDIGRYLADRPVLAGPPSLTYRARKFGRRNRGKLQVATLIVAGLAVVAAAWTFRVRQLDATYVAISRDAQSFHAGLEEVQGIARSFGDPVAREGFSCTSLARELDAIAPLGAGGGNAATWFADFARPDGSRIAEYVAARQRADDRARPDPGQTPAVSVATTALLPDDPLVREAEVQVDQGTLRFYEEVWDIEATDTRLPNLLMTIQLSRLWIDRANRNPDLDRAMEDYRRTIRLGRLLRQEDVMLMNGWTGLRMIQDGLEAIHRRQREAGDAEGASRTALALCSLMAERLEMLKVFDVLLFGSDVRLNWWRLRLVVPEWRVETIRRYASSHPSRAVRIESLNSLAILVGLLDSDARRTVSETLSRLEADHDPIVAKFAEQYVNRAGARATPTSHDLGSGTAEPGGR